jgi:DNA-binding transcriptional MerR regulator
VRLGELSEVTGVPVATIKFYLREGLLPRGAGPGVAEYAAAHADRLRLIATLQDLGGLSLARIAAVLRAIDDGDLVASVGHLPIPVDDRPLPLDEVGAFLSQAGLRDASESARRLLARALLDLRAAGHDVDASVFRAHARAASWLTSEEADAIGVSPTDTVVATVAFGAALDALRAAARSGVRRRP